MRIIALLLVAIVAFSHAAFLVLEMFYWNDPTGREIFGTTPEFWINPETHGDLSISRRRRKRRFNRTEGRTKVEATPC